MKLRMSNEKEFVIKKATELYNKEQIISSIIEFANTGSSSIIEEIAKRCFGAVYNYLIYDKVFKILVPYIMLNYQNESNNPRFGGQNTFILIGDWEDQLALITNVFQKDGEYIYHIITGHNEKLVFKEQELIGLNAKFYSYEK